MSTSNSGAANRSFSNGTRLCPPASTFASPPPSCSRAIASSIERGASYRNRDGYIVPSWSARVGRGGSAPAGLGVGDRDRHRLRLGIGPGLLMRRPWSLYGLGGHLEVLDELRECPHGWALTGLRGVFDQFVHSRVAVVSTRFDRHGRCPSPSDSAFLRTAPDRRHRRWCAAIVPRRLPTRNR